MLAGRVHEQIPRIAFGEGRRAIVEQKPPQVIKVAAILGGIDRQREIMAAFGRTMVTKRLARLQLLALHAFQLGCHRTTPLIGPIVPSPPNTAEATLSAGGENKPSQPGTAGTRYV